MRLLVSVIDAAEARLAVAGGVDVVDVKNPAEGSLGAPAPRGDRAGARRASRRSCRSAPRSATCPACPGTAALAALGAARSGAAYVKLGLWGAVERRGRRRGPARRARRGRRRGGGVAVAYADAARVPSRPLAPSELVAAAREAGVERLPDRHRGQGRPRAAVVARRRRARRAGRRGARRRARDRAGRRAARGGPARGPRHRRRHRRRALGRVPRRAAHRGARPRADRAAAGAVRRRGAARAPDGRPRLRRRPRVPAVRPVVEQLGEPRRLAAVDHPRLDAGGPQRGGQVLVDARGRAARRARRP